MKAKENVGKYQLVEGIVMSDKGKNPTVEQLRIDIK